MPTVNIIGAGRVGKTLARLLYEHQQAELQGILNPSLESSQAAVAFIGAGMAVGSLEALQAADITLITTTDDSIAHTCELLAKAAKITPGSMVVHCSGFLGSEVLTPAKALGAVTASLHPLKSFADTFAVEHFPGTPCALAGDEEATALLNKWVEAWGGKPVLIRPENKAKYHAASVLACSGLTTLFGTAVSLYQACGMSKEEAEAMLGPFMAETLSNNRRLGAAKAMTGPVARGDNDVIAKHQTLLTEADKQAGALYEALTEKARQLISEE